MSLSALPMRGELDRASLRGLPAFAPHAGADPQTRNAAWVVDQSGDTVEFCYRAGMVHHCCVERESGIWRAEVHTVFLDKIRRLKELRQELGLSFRIKSTAVWLTIRLSRSLSSAELLVVEMLCLSWEPEKDARELLDAARKRLRLRQTDPG